jgi:hypothetical protein
MMTELEALKIVWEQATPGIPGANPKLAEAHLKVGDLIERVAKAEGDEFETLWLAQDVMFDIGWVPIEYVEARVVRELLQKKGAVKLARDLSTPEISQAVDDASLEPKIHEVLSSACSDIRREAARYLCEAHGQAWSEAEEK